MAGQDIQKRLQPGQSQPVQVGGDFIFLKFADRPIVVIINGGESSGSRVIMEAGDKYRPGAFQSFEIENTDQERAAQITMTVGRGDYQRQIVQGEIQIEPVLRKEDGTLISDSRTETEFSVWNGQIQTQDYTRGQQLPYVGLIEPSLMYNITKTGPTTIAFTDVSLSNASEFTIIEVDWRTGELVSTKVVKDFPTTGGYRGFAYIPGTGYVVLRAASSGLLISCTKNAAGEYPVLKTMNSSTGFDGSASLFQGLAWDFKNKRLALHAPIQGSQRIVFLKDTGSWTIDKTATRAGTTPKNLAFDEFGRLYGTYGAANRMSFYDENDEIYEDFRFLDENDSDAIVNAGFAIARNRLIVRSVANDAKIGIFVSEGFTSAPEIYVNNEKCIGIDALFKSVAAETIEAEISVFNNANGTVISGEVIKAILEIAYKRVPENNYLDSVYGLEIERDETGKKGYPVITGNRSFAASAIRDDFTMLMPGKIKLITDNRVTFK